jgi:hypothetical protein
VLSAALTRVYEDAGWDLALGETVTPDANPSYPNLTDLQRAAIRIVQEVGYSQRVTDDVLGFIKVRLSGLRLGTTGRFLVGGHQLDFGQLLRTNAVLEIEDVGDDSDKAFLMGTVLIRLVEHLRMANRANRVGLAGQAGLRHLTVIEEAHRLLRRQEGPGGAGSGGAAAHAVEMPYPGRHQEHGGEDNSPPPGGRRPRRRGRDDEHDQGSEPVSGHAQAR